MKAAPYREYPPKGEIEKFMLEEFAACIWRLNRARRVETAFLRKLTENAPDPDTALAMAFLEKTAEMNRLQRYNNSNRSLARIRWLRFTGTGIARKSGSGLV